MIHPCKRRVFDEHRFLVHRVKDCSVIDLVTESRSSLAIAPIELHMAMAKGRKELTLVMVAMTMVVMSSMGGGVAAAPSFPLDCSSFVLDGRVAPNKLCCISVQDQFLLKKSVGIGGYCKAVKGVELYNGPLTGTQLDLALSIPEKCALSNYHAKGVRCAGKVIPGGV